MIEITKEQALLMIEIIDSSSKGEYYNIPAANDLRADLVFETEDKPTLTHAVTLTYSIGDTFETCGYLADGDGGAAKYKVYADGTSKIEGCNVVDIITGGQAHTLFEINLNASSVSLITGKWNNYS